MRQGLRRQDRERPPTAPGGSRLRLRRVPAALLGAILLLAPAALVSSPAPAEQSGGDGVVVSLDGSVSPRRLPRHRPVPVSLTFSGSVQGLDPARPPHLARIEIAVGSRGGLHTAGLPTCPRADLRASTLRHALAACRPALIGHGGLTARIEFPGQEPTDVLAHMLAFNGRTATGRLAVWLLVRPTRPALPSSFVLPFYMQRVDRRSYGLLLHAPVSATEGRWWALRSFRITLGRRYRAEGEWHSYLSAHCPLPPRFHIGYFPLARATYTFAGGPTLSTTITRSCRARD
jgi:hypothetical protein